MVLARRSTLITFAVLASAGTLAGAISVAHAGAPAAPPPRPGLLIGGGLLPSPTTANGYLVNMTIAPETGDLTGPVWVTACNRATCHVVQGGGSLPIVNVPFRLAHAAGKHVTVDVAACSPGFRCARAQFSGVVPAS